MLKPGGGADTCFKVLPSNKIRLQPLPPAQCGPLSYHCWTEAAWQAVVPEEEGAPPQFLVPPPPPSRPRRRVLPPTSSTPPPALTLECLCTSLSPPPSLITDHCKVEAVVMAEEHAVDEIQQRNGGRHAGEQAVRHRVHHDDQGSPGCKGPHLSGEGGRGGEARLMGLKAEAKGKEVVGRGRGEERDPEYVRPYTGIPRQTPDQLINTRITVNHMCCEMPWLSLLTQKPEAPIQMGEHTGETQYAGLTPDLSSPRPPPSLPHQPDRSAVRLMQGPPGDAPGTAAGHHLHSGRESSWVRGVNPKPSTQ